MVFLEGVTVRGGSRYINCSRCAHLKDGFCTKLNYRPRRTVNYCRFFEPREAEA